METFIPIIKHTHLIPFYKKPHHSTLRRNNSISECPINIHLSFKISKDLTRNHNSSLPLPFYLVACVTDELIREASVPLLRKLRDLCTLSPSLIKT